MRAGEALLAVVGQQLLASSSCDDAPRARPRSRPRACPCACRAAPRRGTRSRAPPRRAASTTRRGRAGSPCTALTPSSARSAPASANAPVHDGDAVAEAFEARARAGQRRRVPIDPDEAPVGRRGLEDALGMPARAQGPVAVDPARLRLEQREHFLRQHADMTETGHRSATLRPGIAKSTFRPPFPGDPAHLPYVGACRRRCPIGGARQSGRA